MTESETSNIPFAVEVEPSPNHAMVQPWWIGSLICIFVAATSHFGLLELFGNAAYVTTFALLSLGTYMGILGIWKRSDQFALSFLAAALNIACIGTAVWSMLRH